MQFILTLSQKLKKTLLTGSFVFIVAIALLFGLFPKIGAAPSNVLNYQGKLTDDSDIVVDDGDYDFKLTVWDAETGGNCVWSARGNCVTPTAKTIAVNDGIFNTVLGETGDNAISLTFNQDYWLQVQVGTDPAMTPRRRIAAAGYALNTTRFDGQSSTYFLNTSATGQTKSGALTVESDFTVGTSAATSGAIRLANDAWITAKNSGGGGNVNIIKNNASDELEFGSANFRLPDGNSDITFLTDHTSRVNINFANEDASNYTAVTSDGGFYASEHDITEPSAFLMGNDRWFRGLKENNINAIDILRINDFDVLEFGTTSFQFPVSTTLGFGASADYGFRDNAGDMEYSDDGGSWIAFNTLGGGGTTYWSLTGSVVHPTTATHDVAIGGTTSTAPFFFDESAETLKIGSSSTTIGSSYVAIGTSAAGSGALRLENNAWITAEASPASTDINMFRVNAAEEIEVGNINYRFGVQANDYYYMINRATDIDMNYENESSSANNLNIKTDGGFWTVEPTASPTDSIDPSFVASNDTWYQGTNDAETAQINMFKINDADELEYGTTNYRFGVAASDYYYTIDRASGVDLNFENEALSPLYNINIKTDGSVYAGTADQTIPAFVAANDTWYRGINETGAELNMFRINDANELEYGMTNYRFGVQAADYNYKIDRNGSVDLNFENEASSPLYNINIKTDGSVYAGTADQTIPAFVAANDTWYRGINETGAELNMFRINDANELEYGMTNYRFGVLATDYNYKINRNGDVDLNFENESTSAIYNMHFKIDGTFFGGNEAGSEPVVIGANDSWYQAYNETGAAVNLLKVDDSNQTILNSQTDLILRPDNDTLDYIYLDSLSAAYPTIYWEGQETNDPGITVNSTGQLCYRDDNETAWTCFDDFAPGVASSGGDSYIIGSLNNFAVGGTDSTSPFYFNTSQQRLYIGGNTTIIDETYIGIGTDEAASGVLRLPNDSWIAARNAINGADVNMLKINGSDALEIATNTVITGNFSPTADDTYDLGATGVRWQDLYLGPQTLHIGTSLTDEGVISYNTTTNVLSIDTDSTTNGDIAFFTDDLYLDKSTGYVGIGTETPTAQLEIHPSTIDALRVNPYGASAGNTGSAQFMELAANGSNYVGFKAPDAITANTIWKLPSADGTAGQVLTTDASGTLYWTDKDAGGSAGLVWTSRTSAADNNWLDVTYGNGLFVAVAYTGTGNRVMTSPDGITWTIRTSAADNSWRSVTYGNGLFVAVAYTGTGNRVMTSPDGITWTSRTSAADNEWYGVTYGNGLFVAVAGTGTGNRVMTSPDGITWTSRTSAADNNWRSVTYGNGLFVAVASTGTGNRVMTSPDGITWTIRTSAADNNWLDVTYGNGLFVAVAYTGTGNRVMTSPDGITWTSRTSAADNNWYGVTYGNGLFVAVACTGTGNRVMTSPDGITWTSRTSAADNEWYGVTYGNGLFVAVASTGTGNRVMTSPDGITWTSRTSAADNNWYGVTYGNGLFVAVASTGTGNRVMTSPDGIIWTIRTSAADNEWYGVTYGNGLFVAVASTGTGNRVMTSGAINSGGDSLFTDGGTATYLTSTTDDFAIGGINSTAAFFVDESANTVKINTGGYLNFGATLGTSGYGFRDNGGNIEYRDDGGSWATLTSLSSLRFKEDVSELEIDTEKLFDLQLVSFTWKKDGKRDFGFIAEEMYDALPELVNLDENGDPYSVKYNMVGALLLKEVKKQKEQIENLEALGGDIEEFGEMQNDISNLETMIDEINVQMEEIQDQLNQELNVAQIETNASDIDYIKTLLGFERVQNPEDVDILGKLSAMEIKSDETKTKQLVIVVSDEDEASIGQAEIESGKTEVMVETKAVKEKSRIFTMPRADEALEVPLTVIKTIVDEGFKVAIPAAIEETIEFDWWIVDEE